VASLTWAYAFDAICFVPRAALIWRISAQPPLENRGVVLGWRAPADVGWHSETHCDEVSEEYADKQAVLRNMPDRRQ
jgi:hypothetical protein